MRMHPSPHNARIDLDALPVTGWYPGHMLKAGRQIKERLKLVDLVVELLDARIPQVSRNPAFNELFGDKLRCLVFTKSDLASDEMSERWRGWHGAKGRRVFFVDSVSGRGLDGLIPGWHEMVETRRRRNGATRPLNRPLRVMITGIPNIGKSTLVNRLAASKRAQVGPRPGVTRQQQWIPLEGNVELLDTPGVLWPKIDGKRMELKLTLCGSIKDELIGEELVADYLLEWAARNPGHLDLSLYGCGDICNSVEEFLEAVGRRRGHLKSGGVVDLRKSAITVLNDFRDGRLGKATLDTCPC